MQSPRQRHVTARSYIVIVLTGASFIFISIGFSWSGRARDEGTRQLAFSNTPTGRINGAVNPELIPDQVAYSLLFRLLTQQETEIEKSRLLGYVKQLGITGTDASTLLAAGKDFQKRVGALDQQAKEIKDKSWPHPDEGAMTQLRQLQEQKEAIVHELVSSLSHRLSSAGLEKLHQHINGNVKRKVSMAVGPQSAPGGPGWQPGRPALKHPH
jgi:hypothetical protein